MLYSEKVMDHFRHPRNVGILEHPDGVGEVGNAKCGDIMKIYLKIDQDTVSDVKFETFGCGSAIASSSMATEMIKGKSLDEVMDLTNKAVAEALDGLPAHKLHCSVLAEEAVKAALKDYYDRHNIAYDPKQFSSIDCEGCHYPPNPLFPPQGPGTSCAGPLPLYPSLKQRPPARCADAPGALPLFYWAV